MRSETVDISVLNSPASKLLMVGKILHKSIKFQITNEEMFFLTFYSDLEELAVPFMKANQGMIFNAMIENWSFERIEKEMGTVCPQL